MILRFVGKGIFYVIGNDAQKSFVKKVYNAQT